MQKKKWVQLAKDPQGHNECATGGDVAFFIIAYTSYLSMIYSSWSLFPLS